ncbi:uncharacterized protein CMC5_019400 [Chondromyces crocatus]|uniref:Uncharacterized protein n=1 Tax=Chondromyces crocatus TaxID=52 RepID=A0A0K1EB37_CHOCO|nr:uncharacterized protein CMC5_019400 [Chondromyces crocatus]
MQRPQARAGHAHHAFRARTPERRPSIDASRHPEPTTSESFIAQEDDLESPRRRLEIRGHANPHRPRHSTLPPSLEAPGRTARECLSRTDAGRSSDSRAFRHDAGFLLPAASQLPRGASAPDGFRSHSPLPGSPGFTPGSLLSLRTGAGTSTSIPYPQEPSPVKRQVPDAMSPGLPAVDAHRAGHAMWRITGGWSACTRRSRRSLGRRPSQENPPRNHRLPSMSPRWFPTS